MAATWFGNAGDPAQKRVQASVLQHPPEKQSNYQAGTLALALISRPRVRVSRDGRPTVIRLITDPGKQTLATGSSKSKAAGR
jgi:hypothetical protein